MNIHERREPTMLIFLFPFFSIIKFQLLSSRKNEKLFSDSGEVRPLPSPLDPCLLQECAECRQVSNYYLIICHLIQQHIANPVF